MVEWRVVMMVALMADKMAALMAEMMVALMAA